MTLAASLVAVINPGAGQPPPGVAGKLTTILQWASWSVLSLAVLGIIIVGGTMILNHRSGRGGEHGAGLGFVLGGTVLVAAASGIVGAIS